MRVNHRLEYPKEGGFRRIPNGVVVRGPALEGDQLRQAARFMTPAAQSTLEGWIAELAVIAPRRADEEFTGALKLQAYASRLKQYPADVANEALRNHPWKFFPSWFELEEVCERLSKHRGEMVAAAADANGKPFLPEPVAASLQIERQKDGTQPRIWEPESSKKPRGALPFKPDPSPPVQTLSHLKEELEILQADKELIETEHGQKYAQSLIQRIAQLEPPKSVHTNTHKESA